jgi:transcriptional regulator with XRE-family HTH domain
MFIPVGLHEVPAAARSALEGAAHVVMALGGIARGRRRLKMTQVELASRIPVTPHTISAWETGKRSPSHHHRVRLAQVLGGEPGDYDEEVEETIALVEVKPIELDGRPFALDRVDLRWHTWRDLAPDREGLVAEVRAFVARLRAEAPARVGPQTEYAEFQAAQGFAVWDAWLADPGHPRLVDLTWLREFVHRAGSFHVQETGTDPIADLRAQGLGLIERMLEAAQFSPREAELVAEVRAHLVHVYRHQAQLMAQGIGPPEGRGPEAGALAAKTAAIWDAWLADPAHPNVEDLTWLRQEIVRGGEFFADQLFDPLAKERAQALGLLDRMLVRAHV